jgi:multidrug efflux pump subunit AcrB
VRKLVLIPLAAACSHSTPRPSVSEAAIDVEVHVPDGVQLARADQEIAQPMARAFAQEQGVVHTSSTTDPHEVHVTAWVAGDANLRDVDRRLRARAQDVVDLASGYGAALIRERGRGAALRVIVRSGGTPAADLRAWTEKDLAMRLETVPGVDAADVCGGARRRLEVIVDPTALSVHGVGIDDVAQALRAPHPDLTSGNIVVSGQTYSVRSLGTLSPETLQDVLVQSAETSLPLREVAHVETREVPDRCDGVAPGAIAIDVPIERGAEDRVRHELTLAGPQSPHGSTISIEPAPARYDVALVGGDDARTIAKAWRAALADAPGVQAVAPDAPDVPDWTIDRQAAAAAGLDVDAIETAIATLGVGAEVTALDTPTGIVPVYLRADDPTRVPVRGTWQTVPLAQLARAGAPGPGRIDRLDLAAGAIIRFTIPDGEDADAIAGAAIERARAAAPPGQVHVTSWREP